MRFVGSFLVTFGVAVAIFAGARAVGFVDRSWRDGLIAALAIAAVLTAVDVLANKGIRRLPTSR